LNEIMVMLSMLPGAAHQLRDAFAIAQVAQEYIIFTIVYAVSYLVQYQHGNERRPLHKPHEGESLS